ncbi:MAG: phosphoglycerate kinase [Pirellulaceae bacterium]
MGRCFQCSSGRPDVGCQLAISLVLVPRGTPIWKAATWSIFTSLPQPLMAVPAFLFVLAFQPFLPVGLGLAAGAMIWMVFAELIPDALKRASGPTVDTAVPLTFASAGSQDEIGCMRSDWGKATRRNGVILVGIHFAVTLPKVCLNGDTTRDLLGKAMVKKTIRDIDISGKRLLIRVDFNVPLREDGSVASDRRIRAALPTIRHCLEHNASLVLMTHLGRPGGEREEKLGLSRVAYRLQIQQHIDTLKQQLVKSPPTAGRAELQKTFERLE